jgi:hypothetical protein
MKKENPNTGAKNNRHGMGSSLGREITLPLAGIVLVLFLWVAWGLWGAEFVRSMVHSSLHSEEATRVITSECRLLPSNGSPRAYLCEAPQSGADNEATLKKKEDELNVRVAEGFSRLGQTGDIFGGANALFAALALVGVFWAASMQLKSLSETRRASADQRFETAFFELLGLTREVLERIEVAPPLEWKNRNEEKRKGASALNALASRRFGSSRENGLQSRDRDFQVLELQRLTNRYKQSIYSTMPSALGPYFRLLYQTFDLVDSTDLHSRDKIRYANIARGQISDGAVLLLALNGLTWRGRKFVDLIEKFGLLEHMHPKYKAQYQQVLRMAYRMNAFRGSEERAKYPDEPRPEPGPFKFDRDPSAPDFVATNPMSLPFALDGDGS